MKKQFKVSSISIFCMLAFCFVLAACAGNAGAGSSAATTSMPTPTATPVPPTPTPSPTPAVSLTTVTGDGYTIGYPSGWTSKKNTVSAVSTLQLSSGTSSSTALIAETVTSPTTVSTSGSVKGALSGAQGQGKNFQTKDVPATVTINGITWDQGAATLDDPVSGANSTIYVLSTKFPGNANKLVTLIYTAPTSGFDKANTEAFQPMLLSFKFV